MKINCLHKIGQKTTIHEKNNHTKRKQRWKTNGLEAEKQLGTSSQRLTKRNNLTIYLTLQILLKQEQIVENNAVNLLQS